ncbi:uncharacterized protein LOC117626483 [Prunus dulcis]|uniref:uncharacterized protein LOC117626483 n=1 Tax=Prunus dulcis TaxID=3755 RepID=UPI001482F33E|nr:uncharacterized protein LOC117626483 [Prunus dulcis]
MATFLIRKRQLSHPLVFGTDWTTADCCLQSRSNRLLGNVDRRRQLLQTPLTFHPGTWQHGYAQAWTKVRKVYFPYNLKGSHWVAIEIDFVRHTATVYDSYVDFTKRSKLARVLYDMHFYEDSEVEEVKQKGLTMSMFTPFSVCSIADVPQQRDG